MSSEQKLANAGPLGLMGFGMTTVLLNLHNAGFFPNSSIVFSMGLFYGGLAQVIAGILESRRGNTFGTVAFVSYGFFWISLVGIWLLPVKGLAEAPSKAFMGWYLVLWGVFTLFMFLGTLKGSRVLQFVFLSLTVLFALLALHNFLDSHLIGVIAGIVGLACGASAMYLAMAELLHEQHGHSVLPF
ncbi:MAG: acetate uptake transporter [Spirochaetaceae bacterium]|jgi:succinate-acetate transporter protein|nr:acetate uptake transporter [Spirochaetaceae bacterium]